MTTARITSFRALAASAVLVLSFVVAVQLASNNVVYAAQGGCPGGANPQSRYCANPHEYEDFGAPPIPACGTPNEIKNSDVCRDEIRLRGGDGDIPDDGGDDVPDEEEEGLG